MKVLIPCFIVVIIFYVICLGYQFRVNLKFAVNV
jgi:hypothetical protein